MNQVMFNHQLPQRPLFIFDLDGTLALNDHRFHFIDEKALGRKPGEADWLAYYLACDQDQPNWPVIGTMLQLYQSGNDIRIWSARGEESRGKTMMWLHAWTRIPLIVLERLVKMRPADCRVSGAQLKRKWLKNLSPEERKRLCAVFDDGNSIVKMWREEGVCCMQVAEGDY